MLRNVNASGHCHCVPGRDSNCRGCDLASKVALQLHSPVESPDCSCKANTCRAPKPWGLGAFGSHGEPQDGKPAVDTAGRVRFLRDTTEGMAAHPELRAYLYFDSGDSVAPAVGESPAILLHPLYPLVGVSVAMERERQQNGRTRVGGAGGALQWLAAGGGGGVQPVPGEPTVRGRRCGGAAPLRAAMGAAGGGVSLVAGVAGTLDASGTRVRRRAAGRARAAVSRVGFDGWGRASLETQGGRQLISARRQFGRWPTWSQKCRRSIPPPRGLLAHPGSRNIAICSVLYHSP